ncbi:hypothetical protein VTK56DRAFT_3093 [Thermocarpiscus australiensis]
MTAQHPPGSQLPNGQSQGASTSVASSDKPSINSSGTSRNGAGSSLSPDDVLLILKTGSTSMWKQLLMHLTTTLSPDRIPLKNTVIYSDHPERIGSFTILDVLANLTQAAKDRPDFDVYRQQPQYPEHMIEVEAWAFLLGNSLIAYTRALLDAACLDIRLSGGLL